MIQLQVIYDSRKNIVAFYLASSINNKTRHTAKNIELNKLNFLKSSLVKSECSPFPQNSG